MKFHNKILPVVFIAFLLFNSCSESGRKKRLLEQAQKTPNEKIHVTKPKDLNVIQMNEVHGVYYIPIKINGVPMEFVFDTGASIISISTTEAIFLQKQGLLRESDILGTTRFSDATGTISEGTLINLREVQIGNKKLHNVKASVVHNLEAPLLLGQSALNRFGKVTIDYKNNQLVLE